MSEEQKLKKRIERLRIRNRELNLMVKGLEAKLSETTQELDMFYRGKVRIEDD